jgi:hypothetical protein
MRFILSFFAIVGFVTGQQAQPVMDLQTKVYDSHTELKWNTPVGQTPDQYKLYKSLNGSPFELLTTLTATSKTDFTGTVAAQVQYFVQALNGVGISLGYSDTVLVNQSPQSDSALLDMVQEYTFRYFWDFGHPYSGMSRERNTSGDLVTTGGTGFGVMSILVAIERGFITRQQGLDRLLLITGFLQYADKFHGAFPHWMHGVTGDVIAFSQFDNGGDLVETAFLMQGLLSARQYFDSNDPVETALRQIITDLYEGVEWDWYRKNNSNVLYWHWSPNYGWQMNFALRGFNEVHIVYMLAIASPTHGIPASLYHTGWAGAPNYVSGLSWYGYPLEVGPSLGGPLFFAHYSYLGFDPRYKKDQYANYFNRNRNHTLINRAYCTSNPLNFVGYSDTCWGLTASDNPFGYLAHEPLSGKDNGTITPTAALSSMPYTPDESMAALKHFYRDKGQKLWGPMGFYDAFNETQNWWADSYLAIDQGPIMVMIENYRSQLIWNLFMANPEMQGMLDAIGFVEDLTPATDLITLQHVVLVPNPANDMVVVEGLRTAVPATIQVFNTMGRLMHTGSLTAFSVSAWPAGVYVVHVHTSEGVATRLLMVYP